MELHYVSHVLCLSCLLRGTADLNDGQVFGSLCVLSFSLGVKVVCWVCLFV